MPEALTPIPMPFPARGVDQGTGHAAQPDGTSPDARNVRTFEVAEERARGGQRAGSVKAFTTQMTDAAGAPGRVLEIVTTDIPAGEGDTLSGLTTDVVRTTPTAAEGWTAGDPIDDTGEWTAVADIGEAGAAAEALDANKIEIQNGTGSLAGQLVIGKSGSNNEPQGMVAGGAGDIYEVTCRYHRPADSQIFLNEIIADSQSFQPVVRVSASYQNHITCVFAGVVGDDITWDIDSETAGVNAQLATNTFSATAIWGDTAFNVEVEWLEVTLAVVNDQITVYLFTPDLSERVAVVTLNTTTFNTNTLHGFKTSITAATPTNFAVTNARLVRQPAAPFGRRDVYITAFVPDRVWTGLLNETAGTLSEKTTGLGESGNISAVSLFQKVYAVNGSSGIVVSGLTSSPAVGTWTATSGSGTRPDGYIVQAYRGCAVIAADPADQNNLYMSAVEDPLDWDYGVEPIETSAFALSNSDLGKNADPILMVAPWSDEYMLIGGTFSMRAMRGDPRVGGRIDTVSNSLGCLGPRAWTIDAEGAFWFMGQDGLYRMPRGSFNPERVSHGRLDSILADLSIDTAYVSVAYNAQDQGIHVFISPFDEATLGVHVFYSQREDAFWLDSFAVKSMDPLSAIKVFGDAPDLRNILWGGSDGYLRRFDEDAKNDDGNAISSYVDYPPITADQGWREGVVRELQFETGRSTDAVTWTLRAATDAESLADDVLTRSRTGTLVAAKGFQSPVRTSLRFAAMQLRLANSALDQSWSIERTMARARPAGRRRG